MSLFYFVALCNYPPCKTDNASKVLMIVGITVACLVLFGIFFSVCACHQKDTTKYNRVGTLPRTNQDPRTRDIPMENMYSNDTSMNRAYEPYTISTSTMNNTYTEELPPSYDSYMTYLKQSDQQPPTQY